MNLAFELQKSLPKPIFLESLIVSKKSAFNLIGGFNENVHYAEGRQFLTTAQNNNLSSVIVRDPIYYFSFRRFRQYGTLKLMKNTTALGLSNLLGQDFKNAIADDLYPMSGGSLFNKPKSVKNKFLKNIAKLFKDL